MPDAAAAAARLPRSAPAPRSPFVGAHGSSFLHAAAATGCPALVRAVMAAGSDGAPARLFGSPGSAGSEPHGRTPLHLAACHPDGRALAALLGGPSGAGGGGEAAMWWGVALDAHGDSPSSVASKTVAASSPAAPLAGVAAALDALGSAAAEVAAAAEDAAEAAGWLLPPLRAFRALELLASSPAAAFAPATTAEQEEGGGGGAACVADAVSRAASAANAPHAAVRATAAALLHASAALFDADIDEWIARGVAEAASSQPAAAAAAAPGGCVDVGSFGTGGGGAWPEAVAALRSPPLARRLGFTSEYAAFLTHRATAGAAAAKAVALEFGLCVAFYVAASARACVSSSSCASSAAFPFLAVSSDVEVGSDGVLTRAGVRALYYSRLDPRPLAVASLLLVALFAAASRARSALTQSRLVLWAGVPLLALHWMYVYVAAPVLLEAAVRRALEHAPPPLSSLGGAARAPRSYDRSARGGGGAHRPKRAVSPCSRSVLNSCVTATGALLSPIPAPLLAALLTLRTSIIAAGSALPASVWPAAEACAVGALAIPAWLVCASFAAGAAAVALQREVRCRCLAADAF